MSGVWEEIHHPEEHGAVPIEDAFWDGLESLVVISLGCGCIGVGRSIRSAGDHDPHLAVSQWDAGQEAA